MTEMPLGPLVTPALRPGPIVLEGRDWKNS